MGFEVERMPDGRYRWAVFQSAYGCAGATEDTLPAAKVEMAIAEAELFEEPYPPRVVEVMRSDYEQFAADWPDPPLLDQKEQST